jgi:eukaryotic-like serine/threonine-protein kinase
VPETPLPPNFDPENTILDTGSASSLVIGPYHLLQKIGQGGMGEVWLAEQRHPVVRRVALKLIKAGMNTREIVARFESERQALALMDHPAIAKVFDAGSTPDGMPYFAMEFIAGVPITEYCDKYRLTTRQRLELFAQVCDGVQHAHQKAIIHRDLKPSNILVTRVDDKPVPKIIDFGVAKATSPRLTAETMFTRIGTLVGTPEYMSPEQADSGVEDVDTRTDVYSLGVVLYELLVGALPLDLTEIRNLAFFEVLRRIREEEAPRPSTKFRTSGEHSRVAALNRRAEPIDLGKQLKGDLDSIALKALEKDRSRRYGSPSEFAADIQRYLRDEPVLAAPPSLTYRTRKFVRRHRFGVAVSMGVAFAIVALIASLIIGSVRIARERDRANREAQAAQRVADFLVGTFKVSDPDESRGNKVTAREILDKGARQIETDLAGQPSLQARLMFTMGNVYEGLGLYEAARKLVEKALDLQKRVLGPDNAQTLTSQRLLARILEYQAHFADAEKLYLDTLQRQKRLFGPQHVETIRTRSNLGQLYYEQGRYADAEKLLTEVVKDAEHVSGRNGTETLTALHNLASAYDGMRQYPKEEAMWKELYRRRSQKLGPYHPDTLNSMQNLAYVYYRQGKNAEAERLQREGLEIGRQVLGEDHPTVLLILGNLANTLLNEGKTSEAEALEREALARRRRVLGPNHQETQFAAANLAGILSAEKRYREAESLYREALEGETRILGDKHPEVAYAWFNLATVEAAQGRRAEALTDLHQATDRGFDNFEEISQADEWKALHNDPGYRDAVAQIKNHSAKK